jgi:hypothetical protein
LFFIDYLGHRADACALISPLLSLLAILSKELKQLGNSKEKKKGIAVLHTCIFFAPMCESEEQDFK